MARLTPKEAQEKHAARLKAAVPDIQRGIERVTESPMKKALAKKQKMIANWQKAMNDGKWDRSMERGSLEDWKNKTINKGTNRIASGVDEAAAKIEDFYADFLPFQDTITAKTKQMPDTTLEDNLNRMVHQARETSKYKRKK